MCPNVDEFGRRSTGPNDPIPTACNFPLDCSRKKSIALAVVARGDVVGNSVSFRSSGPVPTAQTNFVPPASMAPNTVDLTVRLSARFLDFSLMHDAMNGWFDKATLFAFQ